MGALIVHAKNDPYKDMYDEELIVTLQDMWKVPEFSMFGGSQFANYADREVERGLFNGVWGDGSDLYPYPLIKVKPNTRYRLRFISMATTVQVRVRVRKGKGLWLGLGLELGFRTDFQYCSRW